MVFKFLLHRILDVLGFLFLILLKGLGQGAPSRSFRDETTRRILVIRTDRIGDIVLSTPAIGVLRDRFPEAHIVCLIASYTRSVVEGNPRLNEVIAYERRMLLKPIRFARFIAETRRKKFDVAIVLNYTPDAILLAYLSAAPVRVGTRIPGFRWFLTESISYQDRDRFGRHEVECVLDVLRKIGIDGSGKELYIPLSERGESFANLFMREHDLEKVILVAIHPGSRLSRMRWNRKGFARVADALLGEKGVRVVMIQGSGENGLIEDIQSMMREKALVTPPEMGITELISLLNRCSLFIGNSTGPMHIASALKIPVIALFGNARQLESYEKWGPWGDDHVVINLPLRSFEPYGEEILGLEEVLTAAHRYIKKKQNNS